MRRFGSFFGLLFGIVVFSHGLFLMAFRTSLIRTRGGASQHYFGFAERFFGEGRAWLLSGLVWALLGAILVYFCVDALRWESSQAQSPDDPPPPQRRRFSRRERRRRRGGL